MENVTAIGLKKRYIKQEKMEYIGVIAIKDGTWWHVHDDEEVPDETIAFHVRG